MSILTEVVGQFLFRFTRGVTEYCNPEEPERLATILQKALVENGIINQSMSLFTTEKYSDREATTWDYLGSTDLDIKVTVDSR